MWQSGSACYGSPALANSAAASGQSGAVVTVGKDASVISVGTVTDTSIQYFLTPINGGPALSRVVTVSPPPCALLTYSDAVSMGWGLALVWLVAWGISVLIKIIRDGASGADNYGNS